jgi:ubiquinone/menaquinone biosynthesis C-methylase UbiE
MKNHDITADFQHADDSDPSYLIKFLEDVHSCETVKESFELQLKWLDIQPGDQVLDVGCGIGDQAFGMAKLAGPTGRVFGTDVSIAMVEMAQSRHANSGLPLEFLTAFAANQPFEGDMFNHIRTERVLMYLKDIDAVFTEYIRLLKPGGKLLVYDVDWDALVIAHNDKALTRRIVEHISDKFPSGRIGAELFEYFNHHGFKDIRVNQCGYIHPLELVKRIIGGIIQTGVEENVFTGEEISNWWAALEKDNAEGRFFASFQGFMVMGTRP